MERPGNLISGIYRIGECFINGNRYGSINRGETSLRGQRRGLVRALAQTQESQPADC
jgi:hypothetical protein